MNMKLERITKRYGRKVTRHYQTWDFSTELSAIVEPGEDPNTIANNLFDQAKALTEGDISFVQSEWEEREIKQ
jgi:hypothetical protein